MLGARQRRQARGKEARRSEEKTGTSPGSSGYSSDSVMETVMSRRENTMQSVRACLLPDQRRDPHESVNCILAIDWTYGRLGRTIPGVGVCGGGGEGGRLWGTGNGSHRGCGTISYSDNQDQTKRKKKKEEKE